MTWKRIVLLAMGLWLNPASTAAAQGIPDRVAALEARIAALEAAIHTRVFEVDCNAGGRIRDALQQAAAVPARIIILISGVCEESLTVSRDGVLLRGLSPGDGLQAPTEGGVVMRLDGADRITLRQLTLTGGLVSDASSLVATGVVVRGSAGDGVWVGGGSAHFVNSVIEASGFRGIATGPGGSVAITGADSRVSHHQGFGVVADTGGTVVIAAGAVVSHNAMAGVLGFNGGHISIRNGAVIENNGSHGVELAIGSTLNLSTGAVVRGNAGHGLSIRDTSVAELGDASRPPEITQNHGYGIACAAAPGVAQIGVGVATITGNLLGPVNCPVASLP